MENLLFYSPTLIYNKRKGKGNYSLPPISWNYRLTAAMAAICWSVSPAALAFC